MWNEPCVPTTLIDDPDTTHNSACTFGFGTRLGLSFVVEVAFASACACAGILLYILVSSISTWKQRRRAKALNRPTDLRRKSHLYYYLISLFVADLVSAIGAILDVRWIWDAGVKEGSFCTAQGVMKQMGDLGVALSSLAITIHCFAVVVLYWHPPRSSTMSLIIIALIWIFIALVIGLSIHIHQSERYYGSTTYWCWIRSEHFEWYGIGLEYGWMWLTVVVNLILYVPISLLFFGVFEVDQRIVQGRRKLIFSLSWKNRKQDHDADSTLTTSTAWTWALYPTIYLCNVLPISIARFKQFQLDGEHRPAVFYGTAIAAVCLASSGLCNVLLYTITRPELLFNSPEEDDESELHRFD